MYFIGVTTAHSSIMKVFPGWASYLGIGNCALRGIDFRPHADPTDYREAVQFIKRDPLSVGALVTTHKIDLLHACRELFDELDSGAQLLGEVSSISKREGRLIGHAKDPISSGLALEAFLPVRYWEETGAEVLLLGAGGSSIALTSYLLKREHGRNRPSRIVVTNRSAPRLEEMQRIQRELGADLPIEYRLAPSPADNDAAMNGLKAGSLVVNATGLGKDGPGSPITDRALFPEGGFAWDFNYRGDLVFLDQARSQERTRNLHVEDGWIYFIHGWTLVIAEVFRVHIPPRGSTFDDLASIAAQGRG